VNPKKILLGFKGADRLEIDAEGNLVLHTSGGDIRQHKPIIYQKIDGVRHEIAGSYVRKGANRVGFQVATYDTSRPLVIDPVVLSTPPTSAGNSGESGAGIAVDADGNAYVTGYTNFSQLPDDDRALPADLRQRLVRLRDKFNPPAPPWSTPPCSGAAAVRPAGALPWTPMATLTS